MSVAQPAPNGSNALGSAAAGTGKQLVKRVILPLAAIAAVADGAQAYEQHCQEVPEQDALACTLDAFTETQVSELRALGHDLSEAWTYVIVPNARLLWDQNGDHIKNSVVTIAEGTVDKAIAVGDAAIENAPKFWNWLRGN